MSALTCQVVEKGNGPLNSTDDTAEISFFDVSVNNLLRPQVQQPLRF